MRSRITPNAYGHSPKAIGLRLLPCPATWTVEALLVTIFLCLPLGAAAMYYSSKVESNYNLGHYDDAARASARARTLIKYGTTIGVAAWIIMGWLCLTGTIVPSFMTFTV